LSFLLVQDGEHVHADSLLNSMHEGCTGLEINMALRYCIKNILELNVISAETRSCAEKLWTELDKAFRLYD
jgi:hypothetical protein